MSELKLVLNLSAWSVQWVEFHKVYSMNRYFIHDFLDLSKSKKSEWELQLHHFVVLLCFGSALLTKQYIGYNMVSPWKSKELSVMVYEEGSVPTLKGDGETLVWFRLSVLEIVTCIPFRFRFHLFFFFCIPGGIFGWNQFHVSSYSFSFANLWHLKIQLSLPSQFSLQFRWVEGKRRPYARQPLSRAVGQGQ